MKQVRWAFALSTLLSGVAALLFFALAYPHHLHYQEQYQLFMFETDYVWQVLAMPGGLADLAGRFLTQFFLYAWVGASIIAIVLMSIQLLCYRLLRTSPTQILSYALSFLPAVLVGCFLCSEHALMSAPMALIIVLGMALAIRGLKADPIRRTVAVVSIPMVYLLAGGFALAYALLLAINEIKNERSLGSFSVAATMLVVALATPSAAHHMVHYPLDRLYAGPHYFRNPEEIAYWAWWAVGILPLLALLPQRVKEWKTNRAMLIYPMLWLVPMLLGGGMINALQSQQLEHTMAYDFMARNAMWNRIIQKAQQQAPKNQISMVALNLALSQRGMLTERMFEYPQHGIAGLLPNNANDYVSPLVTAEAFYRLGMINTAQRYVFEAQEAIPDFQKSARCYKRLAETNLINGAYEVARKYLLALQHTLYYREWATEMLALIADEEAVNAHPEYGYLRQTRCNQDYIFGGTEPDVILARQLQANPQNRMAFEYLEAACMLAKEVEMATQYYALSEPLNYPKIPSAIQQAMLLNWSQHHKATEPMPAYFQSNMVQGLQNFYTAMQTHNGKPGPIKKLYGNTYWSYYYFN